MSETSPSPVHNVSLRSPSPRRGRSYSPRSTRSLSSRSYSRSRSRSRSSYSRRRRSRSRSPYRTSSSRGYRSYYSRSPPPHHHYQQQHHRRSPPPPPRRYRSRSPPPLRRSNSRAVNKDCRVYVSNLPFEVTWHQLKDFMREAGQVAHVDVLKRSTGRSKGCGVVEYRYPEDARRAIHTMNKAEFMGRPVFVREDREFEHSGPPKDPRDVPDDCRLHVSNLPLNASWQDMKDLFRKAGRVLHTDIHTDTGSRRPNGHGTVIFDDARTARSAIDMFHGFEWQGHRLDVELGRYIERTSSTTSSNNNKDDDNNNNRPLPPRSASSSRDPSKTIDADHQYHINTIPPPVSVPPLPQQVEPVPPAYHQNMYRYGAPESVPPPPPMYTSMSLVGGPAANLPTHGHNQIFVNNLPFSTTWQDLIDLFRHVGPVIRSEVLALNGHPKGSGFVRFEDAVTCEKAIDKFHGYMYGGRHLDIRLDKYSTTI